MHQDVEVLPREDEAIVLDEAFEFEIPCEIPTLNKIDWDCGAPPAEWIAYRSVVCSCGIVVRLVCNQCRVKYQMLMAHHAYLECSRCGDETKGFDRFEPLRGGS
jgi:hypothetical protein